MGNRGYAFAEVTGNTEVEDDSSEVKLVFSVEPGKKTYTRKILFTGNNITQDYVLRREMRQFEGAWSSDNSIEAGKVRLERLGYFKEVNVETIPVPGTDDQIDIVYSVEEETTGSLGGNIGYSDFGLMLGFNLQEQNFLVIITAWGLSTLLTNRYKEPNSINHYYEIAPYIKASILTFLFLTFFYYSLRIDSESIQLIYKAGLLHSGLEIMAFFLYFFGQSKKNGHLKNKSKNQIKKINGQEPLSIDQTRFNKDGSYDRSELFKSLKTFRSGYENELTDFIWQTIKIEKISKDKVTILNTSLNINIELLFDNSRELLVNMHRLNDSRRINEYLLTAYSKLESGGLLVGNFIPLEKLKSHLRSQMPHFLYSIILPFYFIFHRVFPISNKSTNLFHYYKRKKSCVIKI